MSSYELLSGRGSFEDGRQGNLDRNAAPCKIYLSPGRLV